MKIYTKTGDLGQTSLVGGERVYKSAPCVHLYGELDELNSHIGLWIANFKSSQISTQNREQLLEILTQTQSEIMLRSSWFAMAKPLSSLKKPEPQILEKFEKAIDDYFLQVGPLKNFVLPGGHPLAAQAHVLRCLCRRCERNLVELLQDSSTDTELKEVWSSSLAFLNRLSDYFFALALKINADTQTKETTWKI